MREITFKQAVGEAMSAEMLRDDNVFLMGEDIGAYGGAFGASAGMLDAFGPERIMDTPISEAAIVGAAVGAAMTGMRPIAEIMFSDFLTIAMDQIVNQAAKIHYMLGGQASVPLVVRTAGGGGTGAAAQHSQSLEAWFCHVPGLKVVMPSMPYDAKGLLISAIRDDNPVIFLEQKTLYKTSGDVPQESYTVPLGCADVKRTGRDISIITYGDMVPVCLAAAEQLGEDCAEVVDVRTLAPLDMDTLTASAKKTGRVLIVHAACRTGGLGAEIAAQLSGSAAAYLKVPIERLCGHDVPMPFSPGLERSAVPVCGDVVQAATALLEAE